MIPKCEVQIGIWAKLPDISRPQFHLPPLGAIAWWHAWRRLVAKVGTSNQDRTISLKAAVRGFINKQTPVYLVSEISWVLILMGHAVSQLVEALRYKSEGRGFDSRWCHWNFFLYNSSGRTMALRSTQPLTEMSTRNILTLWCSWLRHCATSQKEAGLIPDGVTAIFHWHNPSSRTMAVGLTKPLIEISTRNISWK